MTGNKDCFVEIQYQDKGKVTFGDNNKGNIIATGKVKISGIIFGDVYLVNGLKHNLLSISQLCDKGFNVMFKAKTCKVNDNSGKLICCGKRHGNVYTLDFDRVHEKCIIALDEEVKLWHKRLGHANLHTMRKLSKLQLVEGLPNFKFDFSYVCDICKLGKQTKTSFKSKNVVSIERPLQILHMDRFGPTRVRSLSGKRYAMVIVDDYSRYTWVLFLNSKDESFNLFQKFYRKIQNESGLPILSIRSDHGKEFENQSFSEFCDQFGIKHNFSALRTSQQNGVVERKNRTLIEMARTMIIENQIAKTF